MLRSPRFPVAIYGKVWTKLRMCYDGFVQRVMRVLYIYIYICIVYIRCVGAFDVWNCVCEGRTSLICIYIILMDTMGDWWECECGVSLYRSSVSCRLQKAKWGDNVSTLEYASGKDWMLSANGWRGSVLLIYICLGNEYICLCVSMSVCFYISALGSRRDAFWENVRHCFCCLDAPLYIVTVKQAIGIPVMGSSLLAW